MSNQPRPDSPPPDGTEPTTPLDGSPTPPGATPTSRPVPPDATAAPVSGQPWATPSGDPLSPEPYRPPATSPQPPTFKPGYASLPEPADPDHPPTSQFPPTASYPATAADQAYPPPVNYAPPGHAPDYGPAGHAPGQPGAGYPDQGRPSSGYPGQSQPGAGYPGPGQPGSGYPGQGYPDPAYQGQGYPPPGYPAGYPQPPHPGRPGPAGKPPRKSSVPIIAVIVAVTLLLCGGVATAGVLIARNVADRAEQAVDDLPTFDPIEPELPGLPTDLPGVPTELPQVPTGAPGQLGRTISVTYEVTGDGTASQILYLEKLGEPTKRLENVKLPWKFTTKMETPAMVSVIAMRIDTSEGKISCRALVDGAEVKQRTSDAGTVATASCTHFALK